MQKTKEPYRRSDGKRGRPAAALTRADRAAIDRLAEEARHRALRARESESLRAARSSIREAIRSLEDAKLARLDRDESVPQNVGFGWTMDLDHAADRLRDTSLAVGRLLVQLDVAEGVALPTENGDERTILIGLLVNHGFTGARLGLALEAVAGRVGLVSDLSRSKQKQADRIVEARAVKELDQRRKAVADDVGCENVMRDLVSTVEFGDSPWDQRLKADAATLIDRSDEQRMRDQERASRNRLLLEL